MSEMLAQLFKTPKTLIFFWYLSRIGRAVCLVFMGNDGRVGMVILCCVRDQKSISKVVKTRNEYLLLSINRLGESRPIRQNAPVQLLYYAEIQFAGVMEPLSGKKGLDLIANSIIYNGLESDFTESFSHFKENAGLHAFTAIFFEANSSLIMSGSELLVGGEGEGASITLLRAKPFDGQGRDFELIQYGPGEKFHLVNTASKV